MSRTTWLKPILERFPTFESLVLNADQVKPSLWVKDGNGWQTVEDPASVTTLGNIFSTSLTDEEEANYTSTGLLVHREAIDGVGQITVRHVRGSIRTTIVTLTPIQAETDLSRWELDPIVTQAIMARGTGLILVGGTTKPAAELARALFANVTGAQADASAAVIGPEPVARTIARTPWIWISCDPRLGVTHAEDAAESIAGTAQIVLLDVGGNAAAVNAAIALVDAGALVIASVPGTSVQGVLERWEASFAATSERWVATVATLRAVVSVEQIPGRFQNEIVTEYLSVDQTARVTLASNGPGGTSALLSGAGARSRETGIAELRKRGRAA